MHMFLTRKPLGPEVCVHAHCCSPPYLGPSCCAGYNNSGMALEVLSSPMRKGGYTLHDTGAHDIVVHVPPKLTRSLQATFIALVVSRARVRARTALSSLCTSPLSPTKQKHR